MRFRSWGAVVAVAVLAACGGDGGGGGGPTPPPASIAFTPTPGAAPNSIALAQAAGSTSTTLRLDVRAEQVTGLYGVAFDLVYPSTALSFVSGAEGAFLGGTQTSFQIHESSPGRLVIGVTRLGAVAGVAGTGTLLTLQFGSRGAGTGSFFFEQNTAFNASGGAIAGVTWRGGSVTVVP